MVGKRMTRKEITEQYDRLEAKLLRDERKLVNGLMHRRGQSGVYVQVYDQLRGGWKTSRFLNVEFDSLGVKQ